MRKQAIFSLQEKNGYRLYKKNCSSCHAEPLFTNNKFENNGISFNKALNDSGRKKVSGIASDFMSFKVPTLRNVSFTSPYMHDGRFQKLSNVLRHYAQLTGKEQGLSRPLNRGIRINADEMTDLIAFLLTLSDNKFVFNPDYGYPAGRY
jgi:cytochrome c peroxidase